METLQAPKLPEPKVQFIASLSNGETIIEGKNDWCWIDGQKSPWNRLIRYSVDKKLTITSLSLYTPSGATYTLPPIGRKAKFAGYSNRSENEIPVDFEVKRFIARDMKIAGIKNDLKIEKVNILEFYTIAEAIYKNFTLQLWVDENNQKNSWSVIKVNK